MTIDTLFPYNCLKTDNERKGMPPFDMFHLVKLHVIVCVQFDTLLMFFRTVSCTFEENSSSHSLITVTLSRMQDNLRESLKVPASFASYV